MPPQGSQSLQRRDLRQRDLQKPSRHAHKRRERCALQSPGDQLRGQLDGDDRRRLQQYVRPQFRIREEGAIANLQVLVRPEQDCQPLRNSGHQRQQLIENVSSHRQKEVGTGALHTRQPGLHFFSDPARQAHMSPSKHDRGHLLTATTVPALRQCRTPLWRRAEPTSDFPSGSPSCPRDQGSA